MRVRTTIEGLKELRAETAGVKKRLERGDLNEAAALSFFDVVSDKFDREGPGWAALSEMRLERRKTKPEPILDFTGALRKAATSWTEQRGLDGVEMSVTGRGDSMTWELSGKKVQNQWGERTTFVRPGGPVVSLTKPFTNAVTVPARPFWPMESDWERTLGKMEAPLNTFAEYWASGDLSAFDAGLKKAKNRKRTR